ncbi:hypothetical protein BRADI_3g56972v3 [Brachypodium distachyon]|uniref:Uncharacterized protein n=1 Tax=Brachypodium distachyon TaxID=15368 RepID=A0A2K2D5H2_BRADI|nr:hypothetical protein BRADI_3g56972v3 [Brachypodium distachyon]
MAPQPQPSASPRLGLAHARREALCDIHRPWLRPPPTKSPWYVAPSSVASRTAPSAAGCATMASTDPSLHSRTSTKLSVVRPLSGVSNPCAASISPAPNLPSPPPRRPPQESTHLAFSAPDGRAAAGLTALMRSVCCMAWHGQIRDDAAVVTPSSTTHAHPHHHQPLPVHLTVQIILMSMMIRVMLCAPFFSNRPSLHRLWHCHAFGNHGLQLAAVVTASPISWCRGFDSIQPGLWSSRIHGSADGSHEGGIFLSEIAVIEGVCSA